MTKLRHARLRHAVALLLASVSLAACGGPDDADGAGSSSAPVTAEERPRPDSSDTATSGAASASDAGGDPDPASRTIRHKHGSTTIEGVPERVVTVGITDQDAVVALGTVPVGTREWFGEQPGALFPWARAEAGDAELPEVLARDELDIERIAALAPDLILGSNSAITAEEYELLSQVAPTVAQPADVVDYGVTWQEITRRAGVALGVPDLAEERIADVEAQVAAAVAAAPELDGATGLLSSVIDGQLYVYADGPAPRFLTDMGLAVPDPAAALMEEGDGTFAQVSEERAPVLEADVLVLGLYGQTEAEVVERDLVATLDVVEEGRLVALPELSRANAAVTFSSVLSLPVALDELLPRMVAAVDGDPATEVAEPELLAGAVGGA